MSGRADLMVSLNSASDAAFMGLRDLPPAVSMIRLRADLTGEIDPARIRQHVSCPLLYSLRSNQQGGASSEPDSVRHGRLLAAAQRFDFVELESERDLVPHLLAAIAPEQRLVAWYGTSETSRSLARRFAAMGRARAALYLLVTCAQHFVDTVAPLHFLSALGRRDVLAYDSSPLGFWTRLIAPRFGAPLVLGEADGDTPGVTSIKMLIDDYGLPALPPVRTLYGIVGRSVLCSRSPRLHNARFRADGRAALFLPFPTPNFADVRECIAAIKEFAALGLSLGGLTVTAPFKEQALALAERHSSPAATAGAANLLVRCNGGWRAETTDPQGVLDALADRGLPVRGVAAAVIGCGGAGRAIAAALSEAGARVTLVNRSISRGRSAARRLRLPFVPLARLRPASYTLLVNATPVGADGEGMLVESGALDQSAAVVDHVYGCDRTPLVAVARACGLTVIDGLEVLGHQVRHQYALMAEADNFRPVGRSQQSTGRPELRRPLL
jgi:3-dehydroquinate dehydratase / shikimate dehydrogenase